MRSVRRIDEAVLARLSEVPSMRRFVERYSERFVPNIPLWADLRSDEQDWLYGRAPCFEVREDAYEATALRRLETFRRGPSAASAEEDAWSHWALRASCATVEDADNRRRVWEWFHHAETRLFARRLEAEPVRLLAETGAKVVREAAVEARRANVCAFDSAIYLAAIPTYLQKDSSLNEAVNDPAPCNVAQDVYELRGFDIEDLPMRDRRVVFLERGAVARLDKSALVQYAAARFGRLLKLALRDAAHNWFLAPAVPERTSALFARVLRAVRCEVDLSRPPTAAGSVVPFAIRAVEISKRLLPHLPPCMAQKHDLLIRKKHLLHHSRFQYNCFLRSVGTSVGEVKLLWEKNYRYEGHAGSVENVYGLNGSRKSYSGHMCSTLVREAHSRTRNSDPKDVRGCPFAADGHAELTRLLVDVLGCDPSRAKEALSSQSPGKRCSAAFAAIHRVSPPTPFSTPREWTKASFDLQQAALNNHERQGAEEEDDDDDDYDEEEERTMMVDS